jgi:hypothetical protein
MASFLSPTSNAPSAQDGEWFTLAKCADALFARIGLKPMPQYPEGSKPLVTDSEERLMAKIARMLN